MIRRDTARALDARQIAAWRWLAAGLWRLTQVAADVGGKAASVLLADRAMDCAEQLELLERVARDRVHAREWAAANPELFTAARATEGLSAGRGAP